MHSERLTLTFLPKVSPLGDVTYWFSFPYGHTLSIETGISWLLALELSFCDLNNGRMVPISARFSEWWPLSPDWNPLSYNYVLPS